MPEGNADVLYLATPALSVTVARLTVPFRNWTFPVGVPPGDETVAVNVTDFPDTEGLIDEIKTVVVEAFVTTWDSAADVLPVKFLSPPYTAVME